MTNGQVLAKIDDRAAQDEVAKTAAALDDANVRLSHDGPRSEGLTAGRLGVATASADLHAAKRALDDTTLVAPADALVGARDHLGPLVTGGAVSALAIFAALVQPRAGRGLDASRLAAADGMLSGWPPAVGPGPRRRRTSGCRAHLRRRPGGLRRGCGHALGVRRAGQERPGRTGRHDDGRG
ncbi:MAG: hypothetical protein ACR2LJ_07620 [Acidimicrobiales bacterium]